MKTNMNSAAAEYLGRRESEEVCAAPLSIETAQLQDNGYEETNNVQTPSGAPPGPPPPPEEDKPEPGPLGALRCQLAW